MKSNEWIDALLDFISLDKNKSVNPDTIRYFEGLHSELKATQNIVLCDKDYNKLESIMQIDDPQYVLFCLSYLAESVKAERLISDLIQYALAKRKLFKIESQYFQYCQIGSIVFDNSYALSEGEEKKWDQWKLEIVDYYRDRLWKQLKFIDTGDRNRDLVFVVSSQILGYRHSQTAVALEWCKILMKNNKNVLLINSAETLPQVGSIPFYSMKGCYVEEYSDMAVFEYDGYSIPFFQCPNNMPDIETMRILLSCITDEKPGYIISVGDIIFSSLADMIVPVYSVSLSAKMPHNYTKYRSVYQPLSASDRNWLRWAKYDDDSLIRTCFTFRLPEQTTVVSRKDLGIPTNMFCLVIVGNRLDEEMSDEFLNILQQILDKYDAYICFIGGFDYGTMVRNYPCFQDKSTWIEYAHDLLSVIEVCDLYVNPKRSGGGTSSVFALHLGKPVVTLDFGDVALNAGKEFCVSNYAELKLKIQRYIEDPQYYLEMESVAKHRADELTNSEDIIVKQIAEIEKREKFDA